LGASALQFVSLLFGPFLDSDFLSATLAGCRISFRSGRLGEFLVTCLPLSFLLYSGWGTHSQFFQLNRILEGPSSALMDLSQIMIRGVCLCFFGDPFFHWKGLYLLLFSFPHSDSFLVEYFLVLLRHFGPSSPPTSPRFSPAPSFPLFPLESLLRKPFWSSPPGAFHHPSFRSVVGRS